jgi:hypothetical protein
MERKTVAIQEIEDGLVGFFDILGYQSFLENNDELNVAGEVIQTIDGMPNAVTSLWRTPDSHPEEVKVAESIKWFVISDSVLMMMGFDTAPKPAIQNIGFLACAALFCNFMHRAGLPVRGFIARGRVAHSDRCFAGKPIVYAYRLGRRLDLAACGIDE